MAHNYELENLTNQVKHAYGDSHGLSGRLLDFRATISVGASDLLPVLEVIKDYNNFNPKKVAKVFAEEFADDFVFYIARENSVCIYVRPAKNDVSIWASDITAIQKRVLADEAQVINGEIRYWWD